MAGCSVAGCVQRVLISYPAASIQELYSTLEKMQPNLFRMASELKPKEEGMGEILQANDSLIRVMDRYKKLMGEPEGTGTECAALSTVSLIPWPSPPLVFDHLQYATIQRESCAVIPPLVLDHL